MKNLGRRRWIAYTVAAGLLLTGYFAWIEYRRPTINVLLITLDTTRSDHLGCYGNAEALTPALDALARRGVVWEQARTPAPLTLPTHASLFTGLYPAEHGLRSNGTGSLPKSIPTLAERLTSTGYDTGAFVAAFVLNQKFGLRRGFAFYDDDLPTAGSSDHPLERQRDGRLVVESALEWLKRPRRQPFFCWVHFFDAHHPYLPRTEEFGDRFVSRPYDGEIAHVDRQVQRLLDYLKEQRLDERTLVIVLGDHGEGLGDHAEHEHGLTLYDHSLHVPWIWAGPGIAPGRRVSQPVCLIDFTPTVLEYLGLRTIPGLTGRSLRTGLVGQDVLPSDYYFATDSPLLEHGCAPLRSLTTGHWKYIRSSQPELYDLAVDPGELRNRAKEMPDQLADCEFQMIALEGRLKLRDADAVTLSAKDRQVLSSLGYLGGMSSRPTDQQAQLPDIKRRLPVFNAMEEAAALDQEGQSGLAEERLRALLQTEPEYSLIRLKLADVLNRRGKLEDARAELQKVLEREPENVEAYYRLGGIAIAEKRIDEAVTQFERTLHDPPGAAELLYVGQLFMQFGQPAKSRHYLDRALSVDPQLVEARISLGAINLLEQRPSDAEQQYRQALLADPRSIEARANLIKVLGTQQKFSEALPYAAAATKLSPANAELRFLHGTLLMALSNLPEAAREFEATVRLDPNHPRAKQFLEQVRSAMPKK
ncbi:MAG: tetratricopeptide repeat protein [Planctomycetaceae bacterium]|nr:tetratricopeptide repeat protein [Planctomycetaceae bacterium]